MFDDSKFQLPTSSMNLRENWTMIDFHELPTFFMVKTHVLHHLQAALFVDASDDAQVEVDDGALTEMPLGPFCLVVTGRFFAGE